MFQTDFQRLAHSEFTHLPNDMYSVKCLIRCAGLYVHYILFCSLGIISHTTLNLSNFS